MVDTRLVLGGGGWTHSTLTAFTPLGTGFNGQTDQTTEANAQTVFRTAGTLNNLGVQCITHTSNTVISPRKGASSTGINETVTIAATGLTEDTTHSDTVTAGDKWDTQYSNVASTFTVIAYTFSATACRLLAYDTGSIGGGGVLYTTKSQTSWTQLGSRLEIGLTEANSKFVAEKAGTLQNCFVNTNGNTGTGSPQLTVSSRVAGGNGALSVAINAGVNGITEDTTNHDSIAVGNDIHMQVLTGAPSTLNVEITILGVDFTSTNGDTILACGDSDNLLNSRNQTRFGPLGGGAIGFTNTETQWQMRPRDTFLFSNLEITISGNGITSSSVMTLRAGAAGVGTPGTLTATIGASTNGNIVDTTNTYTAAATDLMDYSFAIGVGSGSQTVVLNTVGVHINLPSAAVTSAFPKFFSIETILNNPQMISPISNRPPMFVS